ncbi:uncharacterized protein [Primulina eburnea]|uniref:uncharacterized protein n=1 Tax=Primulina eburnea TaxID=1245227 RepID=UPI003C6C0FF4
MVEHPEWLFKGFRQAVNEYAQLSNLVAAISDHSPLLLKTIQPEVFIQKHKFHFENKWLREPDFQELVQHSGMLGQYKQKLEQLRNYLDPESVEEYDTIRKNMIDLLVQEEDHWRQRAKSFWLKEGDLNTKFFHSNAKLVAGHEARYPAFCDWVFDMPTSKSRASKASGKLKPLLIPEWK